MAVTLAGDTRQAFDSVAAGYHRSNSENPLLHEMRRRTVAAVMRYAPKGGSILDLGCGPGTDAETLALSGYSVIAIDESPRMIAEARRRIEDANLAGRVEVRTLGIEQLDELMPACVDVACSDFGPLNCVADLGEAARLISRRLRPHGALIASVIGRICPWELALYASRGNFERAGLRFARGRVPVPLNGHTVWTRYYTPGEFENACRAAGLRRISLRTLGLFAPPPYLQAFAGRQPWLVRGLQRIDDLVGGWPVVRNAGDHFLIVLRKDGRDA